MISKLAAVVALISLTGCNAATEGQGYQATKPIAYGCDVSTPSLAKLCDTSAPHLSSIEASRNLEYDNDHAKAEDELRRNYPHYVSDGHCGTIPADGPAGVGHNFYWVDKCERDAAFMQNYNAKRAAEAKKEKALSKQGNDKTLARMTKKPPSIGMTEAEVGDTSWGVSYNRHLTETMGHTYAQWVYDDGLVHGYLYFADGILTTIQH